MGYLVSAASGLALMWFGIALAVLPRKESEK